MTTHIPRLRAVESTGPREPFEYIDPSTGDRLELDQRSTPCAGCQRVTTEGEPIVKYRNAWWHSVCAARDIAAGNVTEAWIALGHDLARSPRSYNVRETRAIVGAILARIEVPEEFERDLDGAAG